jgi:hypothetical protein
MNNRLFINKTYSIGKNELTKILIGFHSEFNSIYLIKNNKVINDIKKYIELDGINEDIAEDYYHILLLFLMV